MTSSYGGHDFLVCVTWRIHIHMCVMKVGKWLVEQGCATWDMTHLYVGHTCDMTHLHVGHDSLVCVTWRIHMCVIIVDKLLVEQACAVWNMTNMYVWHDSFTRGAWLIQICDMTYLHVRHDSFNCVSWFLKMCDMSHSYQFLPGGSF